MNQHFAMLPKGWLYRYFDVLPEGSEKIHEALHRKGAGLASHERRHMRLLDAEDFARLRLREAALLDQAVDAQR
jgi:hypothetical protein